MIFIPSREIYVGFVYLFEPSNFGASLPVSRISTLVRMWVVQIIYRKVENNILLNRIPAPHMGLRRVLSAQLNMRR